MLLKVYVETSVIGAYFEERTDVVSAAQCHWSRLYQLIGGNDDY